MLVLCMSRTIFENSHVFTGYVFSNWEFLRPDVVTQTFVFLLHFITVLHVVVCKSGLFDMQF